MKTMKKICPLLFLALILALALPKQVYADGQIENPGITGQIENPGAVAPPAQQSDPTASATPTIATADTSLPTVILTLLVSLLG